MTKDFDFEFEFDEEGAEEWLHSLAHTCIAHMKFVEEQEKADPTGLSVDDYGLLELERGFLTLYALHKKGELPNNDTTKH